MTKDNLREIALSIINKIVDIKGDEAKIISIFGDLGVGKTTLTQEIGRIIGVKENIISPTFVIMKMYNLNKKQSSFINTSFDKLVHIDAYRLKDETELNQINFDVLSKDKNNLIIIEWPEIIEKSLPKNTLRILLNHKDETTRTIKILV